MKGYAVFGALAGLSWYFIYDVMFCPHGRNASIFKHIGAYSLAGGLLMSTIYHPAAFGYGLILGAVTGIFINII